MKEKVLITCQEIKNNLAPLSLKLRIQSIQYLEVTAGCPGSVTANKPKSLPTDISVKGFSIIKTVKIFLMSGVSSS